jgi:hypothetical protein
MLTRFNRDSDPEDYADFESIEDRDELLDLELGDTPCIDCDGSLTAIGAIGARAVLRCDDCSAVWLLSLRVETGWGDDDDDEEDDEEEY